MSIEDLEQKRELVRQRKLQEEAGDKSVKEKEPEEKPPVEEENQHLFLAFARVFSGTLRKGQELFILSPKHDPHDFVGKVCDV